MDDAEGIITKNFDQLEAYGASSIEPKKKKRRNYNKFNNS